MCAMDTSPERTALCVRLGGMVKLVMCIAMETRRVGAGANVTVLVLVCALVTLQGQIVEIAHMDFLAPTVPFFVMLLFHAPVGVCARSLAGVCVIMRALMWRLGVLSVLRGSMVRTARWRVMRRRTAMDVACAVRRMGSACVGVGLLGMRVVSVRTIATRWL